MLIKFTVCFLAGIGAGLGTGFAGMSAAAVISPMLISFLDIPAYEAVGIALASDVLASAVSAYPYRKLGVEFFAGNGDGEYIGIYDLAARNKVYNQSCYDYERSDGACQRKNAYCSVSVVRNADRFYMRLCGRRRRNDDAAHSHIGIRV